MASQAQALALVAASNTPVTCVLSSQKGTKILERIWADSASHDQSS